MKFRCFDPNTIPMNENPTLTEFETAVLGDAAMRLAASRRRGGEQFNWSETQADLQRIADRTGASPEALIQAMNSTMPVLHFIAQPPSELLP